MASVSNFVGVLAGPDKNHHPIISLIADTPTGPQPEPPIGLPTITIVINGERANRWSAAQRNRGRSRY
jgi:hypothetical protein